MVSLSPSGSCVGLTDRGDSMTTVNIELPDGAFSALRRSPQEFVREMRIAAAVQWYAEPQISQEKAAEIAGLCRGEFLDELFRRRVPACQITLEELIAELEPDRGRRMGVECVARDPAG